ncbi:MAG: hypothetical protein KatS3mg059_0958 [Thermomicrobiales bacterium]|nr:MAG: hypothetical protein KatS3mg059_0958 [Thermomicrobiales bacterium]
MIQTRTSLIWTTSRKVSSHVARRLARRVIPGRRAISVAMGIISLAVTVDATLHARALHDMWAMAAIADVIRPVVDTVQEPGAFAIPGMVLGVAMTSLLAMSRLRRAVSQYLVRLAPPRSRCPQSRRENS